MASSSPKRSGLDRHGRCGSRHLTGAVLRRFGKKKRAARHSLAIIVPPGGRACGTAAGPDQKAGPVFFAIDAKNLPVPRRWRAFDRSAAASRVSGAGSGRRDGPLSDRTVGLFSGRTLTGEIQAAIGAKRSGWTFPRSRSEAIQRAKFGKSGPGPSPGRDRRTPQGRHPYRRAERARLMFSSEARAFLRSADPRAVRTRLIHTV